MSAYGILALLVQSYEITCKPPAASRSETSSSKLNILVALNALFALVTSLPLLIAPTVKLYKGPVHEDLAMLMFEEAMIGVGQNSQNNETLLVERAVCYVPQEFDALYAYCHFQEIYLQLAVPLAMVIFLFIKTADAVSDRQAVEAKKS
ncbi:hypothetical protein TYRP_022907 [Tyrophagus putrescentiae]|nr:hypothetical protein TYRP_022907 [Tyrophagus putrescentiae]